MEFEGIVIKITPYREFDAMVNVLSNSGIYSFLARGVFKYGSKTGSTTNLYSLGKFQVFKGKDGNFLRNSEILDNFKNIKNNLESLATAEFIGELTNRLISKEEAPKIYPFLKKSLEAINEECDIKTVALEYFAKVLMVSGYGLVVNSCAKCGQTSSIVGLSHEDGGFICKDCFDPLKHVKLTLNQLKIVKYIFNIDINNFLKVIFNKNDADFLLNELYKFVYEVLEIELKSVKLLQKI